MTSIEKRIISVLTDYFWVIVIALGLIGGVWARSKGIHVESADYTVFIQPWMTTFRDNNGLGGLALDFADYYIPYLTLLAIGSYLDPSKWIIYVKTVSIVFEMVFAIAGALIARKIIIERRGDARWAAAVFAILMMSPMIILDGAFWAQCDYIYGAFVMLAVYFLIGGKYTLAFNMLGLAFVFKQQAILIIPVFFIVWLCNKSFSLWRFVFIPIWYIVGGLPAIIAGRPASNVYSIYLEQTNEYKFMTLNVPNIYTFFPNEYEDFFAWGMMATAVILFTLALYVINRRCIMDNYSILGICLCSTGICGMFLPSMHERYLILYVGFAYIYCLAGSKKMTVLAGILDLMVCLTYFGFLYRKDYSAINEFAAVTHLVILFVIIYTVINTIKANSNSAD